MAPRLKGVDAVIEARVDFRMMYRTMPQVLRVHPSRVDELTKAVRKMEAEAAKELGTLTPTFQTNSQGRLQGLLLGMKVQIDHGFKVTQGEVSLAPEQALEFSL